jgi:hypothetical protein
MIDHEDSTDHDETWDVPRGVFSWVVDFIASRVRDQELAALLQEFLKGGYAWFALTYYSPTQAAEIVRVIREELRAAVDEEFPSTVDRNAGWRAMTDELIGMADRWIDVAASRRSG